MIKCFLQRRWITVWYRNWKVWQKLFVPSLLANFAEPIMILVGLGYGLGFFIGKVQDMPYIVFLTAGTLCNSTMNTATFEGLYSAYTRMAIQQTWHGMLVTPLEVDDIIIGEIMWAATKSLINVSAILIVASGLGIATHWQVLWVLPIMLLVGICFAAIALVITSLANSYDFFLYYSTLVITPLTLLSGVFFPLEQLPLPIQQIVLFLPLAHAVNLTRPLIIGQLPFPWFSLSIIILYSIIATYLAIVLTKRRLCY